jgi:hypothetical protein
MELQRHNISMSTLWTVFIYNTPKIMLSIHIKGQTLDTNPGTQLELEQENPFLQFGDEIRGEYSLPFEVKASPQNLKLLDWAGVFQKRIDNRGIDCQIFDNGLQHSIGKIKIENVNVNRNKTDNGKISCFYLSGVASFFQDIKDVMLNTVDLGGNRTWEKAVQDFSNPTLHPNTFWHHIHDVANKPPNWFDYAFPTVVNSTTAENGQYAVDNIQVNGMELVGGEWRFIKWQNPVFVHGDKGCVIIPFPYLHYVLTKAVQHVGWSIEGDVFNDPDFLNIVMVNFFAAWWTQMPEEIERNGGQYDFDGPVTINLQNHVPEMAIGEFMIALKNRFGWWYDFDRKNKVIRVQKLANVVSTAIKDFTGKASPLVTKKLQTTGKIFSLQNQFGIGGIGDKPQLKYVNFKGDVTGRQQLPAPGEGVAGHVYLVTDENNFVVCRKIEDSDPAQYSWNLYAHNIWDVEPEGATDTITTKATTTGMVWVDLYGQWCPVAGMEGFWTESNSGTEETTVTLLRYNGPQQTTQTRMMQFSTSGIYTATGTQVAEWALTFECKRFDGVDVGLYALNWKQVLQTLAAPEVLEFQINLTPPEFLHLQFSDSIIVDGVKMFLSKIQSTVPFTGTILVEAYRTG